VHHESQPLGGVKQEDPGQSALHSRTLSHKKKGKKVTRYVKFCHLMPGNTMKGTLKTLENYQS
jgi:hypothetical protein